MKKKCEICKDNLIKAKIHRTGLCEECIIAWAEHLYSQKDNYCDWLYFHQPLFYRWERKRIKKFEKRNKKKDKIGPVRSRFEILDL